MKKLYILSAEYLQELSEQTKEDQSDKAEIILDFLSYIFNKKDFLK